MIRRLKLCLCDLGDPWGISQSQSTESTGDLASSYVVNGFKNYFKNIFLQKEVDEVEFQSNKELK